MGQAYARRLPARAKLDLARYYMTVSEGALRTTGGRPNVLVRYPNGVGQDFFYQKRAPASRPEEVVPRDAAALVWLANLACLELHPHPVRADGRRARGARGPRPDRHRT